MFVCEADETLRLLENSRPVRNGYSGKHFSAWEAEYAEAKPTACISVACQQARGCPSEIQTLPAASHPE